MTPWTLRVLAALSLFPGAAHLAAQAAPPAGVVRGVVRDASNGTPLAGARVRFEKLNRGTLTAGYRPHDFYLVEVYSGGVEIRAYTHLFMERMARRPIALIPIGVGGP